MSSSSPSRYTAFAGALLRGITDQLAAQAPISGSNERIGTLIERFAVVSKQMQDQMRGALSQAFPEIGWSASEDKRDSQTGDAPYWVYDPIDGAYHYLQGLPLWSSSLALVEGGRAILALVYDPCKRELFVAEVGNGATVNDRPIAVATKERLETAVVGTALPPFAGGSAAEHAFAAMLLVEISKKVFVVRQMAAASLQLAYVAAGRMDAYFESGTDVYDWIGGCLLVQEAGGVVTSLHGTPFDVLANGVVASARGLHGALDDELQKTMAQSISST